MISYGTQECTPFWLPDLYALGLPHSKSSLNIRKFMVHILLKPGLENFQHYFASMWDECNCVVVWTFFGFAFLWDWPFPKTQHSENEDHGIWPHHFMANKWGNNGNRDFNLGGSKITADGDCSHEMKRCLLFGRKTMTNLDSIFKSRDITLPTKVCLVKAKVFPVVIYGCESWTIKKAEHWRIDGFELWCWRRLLRVPWAARRSNQSILKEISPEHSLEGVMLKLKLQHLATWCEELTHLKRPWFWERLKVGGEGDNRGWDDWMASLTDSMNMSLSKL